MGCAARITWMRSPLRVVSVRGVRRLGLACWSVHIDSAPRDGHTNVRAVAELDIQ
jgi:hypothetical protein